MRRRWAAAATSVTLTERINGWTAQMTPRHAQAPAPAASQRSNA